MGNLQMGTETCTCRKRRIRCEACQGHKKVMGKDGKKINCDACWGMGYTHVQIIKRNPACPMHSM